MLRQFSEILYSSVSQSQQYELLVDELVVCITVRKLFIMCSLVVILDPHLLHMNYHQLIENSNSSAAP